MRRERAAPHARVGRRPGKIAVLTRREYLSRIKSKGFWVATLVLPAAMTALFLLPAMILARTSADQRVVLVDATGLLGAGVAARLAEPPELGGLKAARVAVEVEPPGPDPAAQRAALDRRVLEGGIDAWIWIGRERLADDTVEYHAESVSNVITQGVIAEAVEREVAAMRLADAGFDPEQVGELTRPVRLATVRITPEGSREETGEAGFFLAYGMFFMLYLVLMIWGQQVLTGVLEEKSSRIVEVIMSAARPFDLMMGKLTGIGLAGLTQLTVWLACLAALSAPGVAGLLAASPEGLTLPGLTLPAALNFLGFFVLGYFLFASLFAAVGAAFNNVQEAQHFTGIPIAFLVAPIVVIFPVINDPDSTLATVVSLIPLFTPVVMPVRIAVKMPPVWEVALAYLLTAATVVALVWLCARIYRVGILMHGKKPTLAEIVRWVRYA
jgi:ABC-2 type transport system permease protein